MKAVKEKWLFIIILLFKALYTHIDEPLRRRLSLFTVVKAWSY